MRELAHAMRECVLLEMRNWYAMSLGISAASARDAMPQRCVLQQHQRRRASSLIVSTLTRVRNELNQRFLSSSSVHVRLTTSRMPIALAKKAFNGDVSFVAFSTAATSAGETWRLLRWTRIASPSMPAWHGTRASGTGVACCAVLR
jgi:hypothetical protein